jgi:hypothetical protein
MLSFRAIGYMGRLGNQMFQFSSSVSIAKKLGHDIFFPIENCSTFSSNGPIDPKTGLHTRVKCDLLECFNIPVRFFKTSQNIKVHQGINEKEFTFDPDMYKMSDGTDIMGYFQTERYFKEFRDKILGYFSFRPEIENSASLYWEKFVLPFLSGSTCVSVHVRRGDYTLYPNHHPPCSKEYYDKAMSSFGDEDKFLIFSDDIDWCRGNFNSDRFHIVDSGSPYVDLKLITMCDHHINANSSFSWWGSWLNRKDTKRVICPSNWFGSAINKDTKDVYCEGWEVI